MSNRIRPAEPARPAQLAPQEASQPAKRIWVVSALGGLLFLSLLLSAFSVWVILRAH